MNQQKLYRFLMSDYESLRRKKNKKIVELEVQKAEIAHIIYDFLNFMDKTYKIPGSSWINEFTRYTKIWRKENETTID